MSNDIEKGYYWGRIELAFGGGPSGWMPFYFDGRTYWRGGEEYTHGSFIQLNLTRIKNPDEQ